MKLQTPEQEAAEDLYFGQIVLILARWAIVFTGVGLVLTASTNTDLTVRLVPVIALMAVNFFLHGRYYMEIPASRGLVLIASLVDIAVVAAIVVLWKGARAGVESDFYFVFLYPLIFAFALVFRPAWVALYTTLAVGAYVVAVLIAVGPLWVFSGPQDKTMLMRIVTLLATAGLGAFYYRKQRDRRRAFTAAAPAA